MELAVIAGEASEITHMKLVHTLAVTIADRRLEELRLNILCEEGMSECPEESLTKRGIEKRRPR